MPIDALTDIVPRNSPASTGEIGATATAHSDGGNIAIKAGNLVQLRNSEITTNVQGGAGSAVLEALAAAEVQCPVLQLGLPDVFIEHGDPAKLLSLQGLDARGIAASVRTRFGAVALSVSERAA